VCFVVVVYDVNLYIIIIVTQRDGFRKANFVSLTPEQHSRKDLFQITNLMHTSFIL